MFNFGHPSETDLLRLADGELAGTAVSKLDVHLQECTRCHARFEELRHAYDLYAAYHAGILKSSLPPEADWPALRLATAEPPGARSLFSFLPAATAISVLCCIVIAATVFNLQRPQRAMTKLLARAATVKTPARTRLQIEWNGRSWYRSAVPHERRVRAKEDQATEHARSLFVKASYSWNDPLSARSFAAWRNQLPSKRDEVMSLRSESGEERFYRLRTESSAGILRSAALMLHADTLRPVEGRFDFVGESELTMFNAGVEPETWAANTNVRPSHTLIETKATPEDELRVFAALNTIGADAGEPLTVAFDSSKEHVIVRGTGLSSERQREIRQALRPIPSALARFEIVPAPLPTSLAQPAEPQPGLNRVPLRRELETKSGGAQNLQQIADNALDTSATLLAHAQALTVLSDTFPVSIESRFGSQNREELKRLRHLHAATVLEKTRKLRATLQPLLNPSAVSSETVPPFEPSWHTGVARLLTDCRTLDQELSQILAGNYTPETGSDILSRLPAEIDRIEALARAEEGAP